MLSDHPIDPILFAPDLKESNGFYSQELGLEILSGDEHTVTFRCGGDSRLVVSSSTTGTAGEQTQVAWRVENLARELAGLRSRGVEIMGYDTPELKTENAIVDTGHALHAWIVDPGKNVLGIDQYKGTRR